MGLVYFLGAWCVIVAIICAWAYVDDRRAQHVHHA